MHGTCTAHALHIHCACTARGRESPLAALPQLLSRLQDGSPFVLYNPSVAPLADCLHYCQKHKLAVRLQLLEGFTRAYQVAANRTHPTMNTYPPTGCVLSGVKVSAPQPQPHT